MSCTKSAHLITTKLLSDSLENSAAYDFVIGRTRQIESRKNLITILSKQPDDAATKAAIDSNLEDIARFEQQIDSFNLATLLKDDASLNAFASTLRGEGFEEGANLLQFVANMELSYKSYFKDPDKVIFKNMFQNIFGRNLSAGDYRRISENVKDTITRRFAYNYVAEKNKGIFKSSTIPLKDKVNKFFAWSIDVVDGVEDLAKQVQEFKKNFGKKKPGRSLADIEKELMQRTDPEQLEKYIVSNLQEIFSSDKSVKEIADFMQSYNRILRKIVDGGTETNIGTISTLFSRFNRYLENGIRNDNLAMQYSFWLTNIIKLGIDLPTVFFGRELAKQESALMAGKQMVDDLYMHLKQYLNNETLGFRKVKKQDEISPSLRGMFDEKSDVSVRDQFRNKMPDILKILGVSKEIIMDKRAFNSLLDLGLSDDTMKNIFDSVDQSILQKVKDIDNFEDLPKEVNTIVDSLQKQINDYIDKTVVDVKKVRDERDIMRYVLDNKLLAEENVVWFDAQVLSKDPTNAASQKLSEEGFRYGVKLPGVIEAAYDHKSLDKFKKAISKGNVKTVVVQNQFSLDKMWDAYKAIEKFNEGKDVADRIDIVYPTGKQAYSYFYDAKEGLTVRAQFRDDAIQLRSRIEQLGVDVDEYNHTLDNEVYHKNFAAVMKAEMGDDIELAKEIFKEEFGDISNNEAKRMLSYIYSTSGYQYTKRMTNIANEKVRIANMTAQEFMSEANRIAIEMNVVNARDFSWQAIFDMNKAFVPEDRTRLDALYLGMSFSPSVQEKQILRKAFLEEIGVVKPNSLTDLDNNIHIFEDAVKSMEGEGVWVPVYFGTNDVFEWMHKNTAKINNFIQTNEWFKTKIPANVQDFVYRFVSKNQLRYGGASFRDNLNKNLGQAMADLSSYLTRSSIKEYNVASDVDDILKKVNGYRQFEYSIIDNTDWVYDKFVQKLVEPNTQQAKSLDVKLSKKDDSIFWLLDRYRKIADGITEDTPYRDVVDLKRTMMQKVEEYEKGLLDRYQWLIHPSEFSSKKSNVFIADRVGDKEEFFRSIENLEESYKFTLEQLQRKRENLLDRTKDTVENAQKEYEQLFDIENGGFYTTVVDDNPHVVQIDDVIKSTAAKIPNGTDQTIDAIKSIDLSLVEPSQKVLMVKILKYAESALYDDFADIVGTVRGRIMPKLKEFFVRYAEDSVSVFQDDFLKRTYWQFNLPKALIETSPELQKLFKDVGELGSVDNVDLIIKKKLYQEVSKLVSSGKDLNLFKMVDKLVPKIMKAELDAPLANKLLASPSYKGYADSLVTDFTPYESLITLDIPEDAIKYYESTINRNSTLNGFVTEQDRAVMSNIELLTTKWPVNLGNFSLKTTEELFDDVRYLHRGNEIKPVEAPKVELKKTMDQKVNRDTMNMIDDQVTLAQKAEQLSDRFFHAGDVRGIMNKTSIFKKIQQKIQKLADVAFQAEGSPVTALNNVKSMSVEDVKKFKEFYKDQVRSHYIPKSKTGPEADAFHVYRYFDMFRDELGNISLNDQVNQGIEDIHAAIIKQKDFKYLADVVKGNRVFEMMSLSDEALQKQMSSEFTNRKKTGSNFNLLNEQKYQFWKDSFVPVNERKLLSDKDMQTIYDVYGSSGYMSRLSRWLSMWAQSENKVVRWITKPFRLWEGLLGGSARAIPQVPWYVWPMIFDTLLEKKDLSKAREAYELLWWGAAAWPTLSSAFGFRIDDNWIQRANKIFDFFAKNPQNVQAQALRDELKSGINQFVDVVFRGYAKDKSFYDAVLSVPSKETRSIGAFVDFIKNPKTDGQYKRDLVQRIKQAATRNFDLNSSYHLSRWSERSQRWWTGMLNQLANFRGSWGVNIVRNFFSELASPVFSVGWVWGWVATDVLRGKYKSIDEMSLAIRDGGVAVRDIMWNSLESHTAWTTMFKMAYWSNKIQRLLGEDYADPNREDGVVGEALDILRAMKWFFTPAVALDTSLPGRIFQNMLKGMYDGETGYALHKSTVEFMWSIGRQFRIFNAIPAVVKGIRDGDTPIEFIESVFNKVGGGVYNYYADYSEGYYGKSVAPASKLGYMSMFFGDKIGDSKATAFELSSITSYEKFKALFSDDTTAKQVGNYLKYDIGYKIPLANVFIKALSGSWAFKEGELQEIDAINEQSRFYQSMVKDGIIDMEAMRRESIKQGKPELYNSMVSFIDRSLTRKQWLPGEGKFTEIFSGMQNVEWVDNVVFQSFVAALDDAGQQELFLDQMRSTVWGTSDKKVQEIAEILNIAKAQWSMDEDAFIGASRSLLWFVYQDRLNTYKTQFAKSNKAAGLSWAKDKISDTQEQAAIESAVKDIGKVLPQVDLAGGMDIYAQFMWQAYPELDAYFTVEEWEYKGVPFVNSDFASLGWSRIIATEMMYDGCLARWEIDCIGTYKNVFKGAGSFLPDDGAIQVQLINNALNKIDESPDMSLYDKASAKSSVLINNPDLLDIIEDLDPKFEDVGQQAVNHWYWSMKNLYEISEGLVEQNEADKARGSGTFKWLWKIKVENFNSLFKAMESTVAWRKRLFNPLKASDATRTNQARYFPKTRWDLMSWMMKRIQNSTWGATVAKSESFFEGKGWRGLPSGRKSSAIRKPKAPRKPKSKKGNKR